MLDHPHFEGGKTKAAARWGLRSGQTPGQGWANFWTGESEMSSKFDRGAGAAGADGWKEYIMGCVGNMSFNVNGN